MSEAAQMRARLAGLGLDSMVDVHTHFMPQRVLDKVWRFFDGVDWGINYRTSEAERLASLRSFGVAAFSSLNYPHKPGMAEFLNAWSTEFAAVTPDCLHSGTFYPEPAAADYVLATIEAGARIFKVHVQVGGYDPNSPLLDPVWGALAEAGTPIVIHAGNGPHPGEFTGVGNVAKLLSRFPTLRLIIAHFGLPDYEAFLDLAQRYPISLDTTMVFTAFTERFAPFPVELRPRLADLGEQIVFGSDFPNIPYPYVEAVDAVLALDLGAQWNRRVLAENARELFGLGD